MDKLAERRGLLALSALVLFVLLIGGELWHEEDELSLGDAVFEVFQVAVLVGCAVAASLLAMTARGQAEQSQLLRGDLRKIQAETGQLREELDGYLQGLAGVIQRQFGAWGLSPAEQEVGLFLLKGFSHKEIARLRRASEATVRQQAAAVYGKSGLSGRAGLSAYFLEGMLFPEPAPTVAALPRKPKAGVASHA